MNPFQDRTAIVTGGASGIGRALGEELARRGTAVVLADIDGSQASQVADAIRKAGGAAEAVAVDVTDPEAVGRLVQTTVAARGQLDYLFNNAGIGVVGEERDVTLDDYHRVMAVDFWGVVHGIRAAWGVFAAQRSGHIVNTASLAGLTPVPAEGSYTAAKHAVVGLSLALRAEGRALGIRVSVVCPGLIDTPILTTSPMRNLNREEGVRRILASRPMAADQCARKILAGVARNRAVIVVTASAKFFWALTRISPAAAVWLWEHTFLREIRTLRPADR